MTGHVQFAFATGEWRAEDFVNGMKYGMERDWLDQSARGAIKLLDAGFAEM